MEAKRLLRSRLLAARVARAPLERVAAGVAIAEYAAASWAGLGTVAAYAAVDPEPPTRPLLDALLAAGSRVILPIVTDDELDWADYPGWDALVRTGPLRLPEPATTRLGPAALSAVDVVVVPALAVDRHGHRLGRGGGHYDRALRHTTAFRVAVVYPDEVLDEVPTEEHDVSVDAVLLPSGLLALGGD